MIDSYDMLRRIIRWRVSTAMRGLHSSNCRVFLFNKLSKGCRFEEFAQYLSQSGFELTLMERTHYPAGKSSIQVIASVYRRPITVIPMKSLAVLFGVRRYECGTDPR